MPLQIRMRSQWSTKEPKDKINNDTDLTKQAYFIEDNPASTKNAPWYGIVNPTSRSATAKLATNLQNTSLVFRVKKRIQESYCNQSCEIRIILA